MDTIVCLESGRLVKLLTSYSALKMKIFTAQKRNSSIKDLFSKCDQIPRKLHTWSHLLKKIPNRKLTFLCIDHGYNIRRMNRAR